MKIFRKIERGLRGEVAATKVLLEMVRRSRTLLHRHRERAKLQELNREQAHLLPRFARLKPQELLTHFRARSNPHFFSGLSTFSTAALAKTLFLTEISALLTEAERILEHRWSLLGLGEQFFGKEIDWHRDPLSGKAWPREFYADIKLVRGDGSDARVVWELNRLAHLITLARAYSLTRDERFTAEFLQQVASWQEQNPFGVGVNWNCAMEVALRAMNLLGAFELFRHSPELTQQHLLRLLQIFDQHGTYIQQHLEFSHVATSNHYLTDVVGLFWLGLMLPEFSDAAMWREFSQREMLREMEKQILPNGADFEASTGYHRYVCELFLYSFILAQANGISMQKRYRQKLYTMLDYLAAYVRPDGRAPIIGDSDSGQVFPMHQHAADDHAYVLAIGAAVFDEPKFKLQGMVMPEDLFWILGEQGISRFKGLQTSAGRPSQAFNDAGTYLLRHKDLYLLFNASDTGANGRGSHGHNDALSIEVAACGRVFIVDPGTYVYTADLDERHRFRSTAYHSTVQIDGLEQNSTERNMPFVLGNEARPRLLFWEIGPELDQVAAEHYGYQRLEPGATHSRTIVMSKADRCWMITDDLKGKGEHLIGVRFHFASGLDVTVDSTGVVTARDNSQATAILVSALDLHATPSIEAAFNSSDYAKKEPSLRVCWRIQTGLPCVFRWLILPIAREDNELERLRLIERYV